MQGPVRERIREVIRQTCTEMGTHIVRSVLGRDHGYMFLSIPPKFSLSDVMQRIKGRSSRPIQMEFPELRKRYWSRKGGLRFKRAARQATETRPCPVLPVFKHPGAFNDPLHYSPHLRAYDRSGPCGCRPVGLI